MRIVGIKISQPIEERGISPNTTHKDLTRSRNRVQRGEIVESRSNPTKSRPGSMCANHADIEIIESAWVPLSPGPEWRVEGGS